MFRKKNKPQERRPNLTNHSTDVFSYHASRSSRDTNIGRYGAQQRSQAQPIQRFRPSALPVWISLLVIVVALVYSSTLSASPRVAVVADEGSLHRSVPEYQTGVTSLIKESIFNRSKLTINTGALESKITQQFPEISVATVSVPLAARRPVVQIMAAKPAFILQSRSSGRFYINQKGVAIVPVEKIESAPGGVTTVDDQSGLEVQQGNQVLPKDTVAFIVEIERQLHAKDVTVAQFVLPAAPNELQARIQGKPYYVRFNTTLDARQQAGTYLALNTKLEGERVIPQAYIDLRVPERAYYK